MRLFLAINLAPAVRRALIEATGSLRAAAPSLGWVDESRMHLTLKFLGEQSEDRVPALSASLEQVAAGHRSFSMRIGDAGAFPNFRRARVVWIGVHRDPRLELLHHDVEVACEALGYELDGRAFRPHLTLARVKESAGEDEMRALARAVKRLDFQAESAVEAIALMRSNVDRAGARYSCLATAALRPN